MWEHVGECSVGACGRVVWEHVGECSVGACGRV